MHQRHSTTPRHFLFLQGPHGPFFDRLGGLLRKAGHHTWRVGFNAGDKAFWRHRDSFVPYTGNAADWPDTFAELVQTHAITDIVLYGDIREIHARAIDIARQRGLTIHVFEEGYMRPYWVTYERGGSNGHSRLMQTSIADMAEALNDKDPEAPLPPAHWGDMREHVFYGALYHWHVMFRNRAFPGFRPHRDISVAREFGLYLQKLLKMPLNGVRRLLANRRVRNGGFPYHLALLQLEHDSSFQAHSPFATMTDFLREVMEGFASGAPGHHHLVIKAHPLEDNRVPLRKAMRQLEAELGLKGRVHYLQGGKLAQLLDDARTAVTINSTAGQQVLWRGMPLRIFGTAIYDKPELVSDQPLDEFFANPHRPDSTAYRVFRRYLLETSQVAGGFYAMRSRQQLLRAVTDMMLSPGDPYENLLEITAASRQQLRIV